MSVPEYLEPPDVASLVRLLSTNARGRWDVVVCFDGRAPSGRDRQVIYAKVRRGPGGERLDPTNSRSVRELCCCLRCGTGRTSRWRTYDPTAYEAEMWIALCVPCLAFYLRLWPGMFRRLRLGVRAQVVTDKAPLSWLGTLPHDWDRRPPFAFG